MKEIAKNVFQLPLLPGNGINCYVVEDILIDSGIHSLRNKLLKSIRNKKINKHILTHAHSDHQGGSAFICNSLNIPLFTSEPEKENAESGYVIGDYPNPTHWVARLQQRFWAGEGCRVSGVLKEGDTVGGFTVIETPGHSLGHLSFFREKDKVLILGDVLVNMNLLTTKVGLHQPPDIFTTDKKRNIESIKKIHQLSPEIICFGHGPVLYNKGELEKFVSELS